MVTNSKVSTIWLSALAIAPRIASQVVPVPAPSRPRSFEKMVTFKNCDVPYATMPAAIRRGLCPNIMSNDASRSGCISGEAGSARTREVSRIDSTSGTNPHRTIRLATVCPCSSDTALDSATSIRNAKIPASTASQSPSATCLLPSTPASTTMPP